MNTKLKDWLSVGMVVLSGLVIVLVLRAPRTVSRHIDPSLVSTFGWEFGLIFTIFQIGFCYYFKIKNWFLLFIGIWIVSTPLVYFGPALRLSPLALSGIDRAFTGVSCLTALVVGIGVLKSKL